MGKSSEKYVRQYRQRSLNARRPFFYDKISQQKKESNQSLKKTIVWALEDIGYLVVWSLNSLLVLKAYGRTIKKNYGISYFRQFRRMMYLLIKERVLPKRFRTHLLFKDENWKRVDKYIYEHYDAQYKLAKKSAPEEIQKIVNKYNFYKYCKELDIPTPKVLAVFENGKRTDSESTDIQFPKKGLFIKNLFGKAGQGVKKLIFSNGTYHDLQGREFTSEEIIKYLATESSKNKGVMIQELVENHDSWKPYTPGGLSTCRLVTGKSPRDNTCIPLFCAFRMPVGNADGDNYSTGGLFSAVDIRTGKLGVGVGAQPYMGRFEYNIHPDTKFYFKGTQLPHWDELLEFTLQLHKKFKTIFVGWDVSMTTNGCCLIEANIGWSAGSFEIPTQQPLGETEYPELFELWMEKF